MKMESKRLTGTKRKVFFFIKEFIKDNKYPPTVREIAEGVDLYSHSTVHGHLARLQKNGLISFVPNSPRTIVITEGEV
jgi:repressor LexA